MGMLDDVRALLALQECDRRLLSLIKDLEKLPQDEARAKGRLADDQAAVAKAHDAIVECELRLKRLELDAGTRRTTIQRLKTQQFETRKNDEYQALAHEITRYEKEVDTLETQELEIMEEIDGHRAVMKTAEAALGRTQTLVDEDLAGICERKQRIQSAIEAARSERAGLAAAAPEGLIPVYDRLMKTKDGIAVAPEKDGRCGGCHMKLIASTVVAAQSGREVVRCENCGRILYVEE
jgi:predicted  nucleic acid-binding Zn-ribbon protein